MKSSLMEGQDGGDGMAFSALTRMLGQKILCFSDDLQIEPAYEGWVDLMFRVFPLILVQGPITEWKC